MTSTPTAHRINTAPEPQREARRLRYDEGAFAVIADQELYDFAVELFQKRYEDAFGEPPRIEAPGFGAATRSANGGGNPQEPKAPRPRGRATGRRRQEVVEPKRGSGLRAEPEAARGEQQLRRDLSEAQAEAERLRRELDETDATAIERLRTIDTLEREVAAARLELRLMRGSRTWQLGRPFRAVANGVRRLSPRRRGGG